MVNYMKRQEFTAHQDILLYAPLNTPLPGMPAAPAVGALPAGALSACVARARQRAGQIKTSPAYTTAIGEDCRIVTPAGGDEDAPKPVLKATVQTDFAVLLEFAMFGHDQTRNPEPAGGRDGVDPPSASTPTAPTPTPAPRCRRPPENRRYRARYRDDDRPVGEWSDIIEVTAAA